MKKLLQAGILSTMIMAMVAGCSSIPGMGGGSKDDQKYYVGDTVSTRWFDYTINQAEAMETYEGYTAGEGNKLIVVDLEMTSTFMESIPMYNGDFQLYWPNYQDGDDYCFALEQYTDKQLPDEYSLPIKGEMSGSLVYEVPTEQNDFQFMFLEIMDDGSEDGRDGNLFTVYFTAE